MSHSVHTLVRDLRLRRGRERRGLALAEGVRLVEEAVAARITIRHVLVSPALEATARGRALKAALVAAGGRPEAVTEKVFDSLAATEQPQGVLAVVEPPRWRLEDVRPRPRRPVLVLDGVQDPGNVGTMLRTAWGLGAAGVLVLPGTAEVTNPKTLRATMGAFFRLPVVSVGEEEFPRWVKSVEVVALAAEAGGTPGLTDAEKKQPIALVVGNEGAGIRPTVRPSTVRPIAIPLSQGAESLNVAVAAGILLYEVTRG